MGFGPRRHVFRRGCGVRGSIRMRDTTAICKARFRRRSPPRLDLTWAARWSMTSGAGSSRRSTATAAGGGPGKRSGRNTVTAFEEAVERIQGGDLDAGTGRVTAFD